MQNRAIAAVILVAITAPGARAAFDDTITFSDVPIGSSIDGVTIRNVLFSFAHADRNSAVVDDGLGVTPFVSMPSLSGSPQGTLSLNFLEPVTSFGFGFALSRGGDIPDGAVVDVFDPDGAWLATVSADGKAGIRNEYFYSSSQLTIQGLGPIGSASINFAQFLPIGDQQSQQLPIFRFAFDNLGYSYGSVLVPMPTPSLMGAAGLACVFTRRRRTD